MSVRARRVGVSLLAVLVLAGGLVLAGAGPAASAGPANDAFSSAQPVSGAKGLAYGTVAGATIENGSGVCNEPQKAYQDGGPYGDRSVWYRWTAPANGWLRFGVKAYGGWRAYVDAFQFRGSCWRPDAAGYTSSLGGFGQLEVRRGQTIWFGVYSFGAANVGTFALGWRLIATPPPLNDRFANADVVWGRYGKQWGNNTNATRDAGEPAHAGRAGGRSVWYRWTAPASGPAMVHAGGFDCLVAVYTGALVDALTPVAADTGTWAGGSCTARFTAAAGQTYRIAVDGEAGKESQFLFTWNSGPRPANDNAAAARTIAGFHGYLDDTNRGATDEAGEPRHAPTRAGSSVWYRWTAPDDGEAGFWVMRPPLYEPSSELEDDKRIAVFTGTPPGALTLQAESRTPPIPSTETFGANLGVTRGTTYWIQVTGVDEQVIHYTLEWRLLPQGNDEFAEPMVLPPTGGVAVDTTGATAEPGEPAHGRYQPRTSLWFRWTAPRSGTVTFDDYEEGDGFDAQPVIAAYTGDHLDALTRVPVTHGFMPEAWNTFSFPVTAGVTYRIALDEDGPFAYGMRHRLNWYFGTKEWNDPTVALTAPADGARVSGVAQLDATASDDSGVWSVGYSHDLAAGSNDGPQPEPAPYGFGLDTERYADGPLELTARAWDVSGNRATSAPQTIVIENHPPFVRLWWNPPERLTFDTSAHFEWEASEPLSRSVCSLDGAAYADCSGQAGSRSATKEFAGLADGVHVFRVVTTDMAGKVAVDADAYQWIVDTKGLGVLLPDDDTLPTVTGPVPDILAGHPIGNTTAAIRMRWTSSDGSGTGVQRHDVQASTDGVTWTAMPSYGSNTAQVYQLASGRTYRFRVRAWDWAGNVSPWAYGPSFVVSLAQETSTAWRWSAGWARVASGGASAGYVELTGTRGAAGRLTFRGRSVGLYGPRTPSLGLSGIYLDGVRVATVNQWSSAAAARETLYVRNGLSLATTHVLEVRSLGTPGHDGGGTRVAIDAASVVR
ncbi:MAG TPA: Ig-like domain-containing protein [Actinomycetes bacterium]